MWQPVFGLLSLSRQSCVRGKSLMAGARVVGSSPTQAKPNMESKVARCYGRLLSGSPDTIGFGSSPMLSAKHDYRVNQWSYWKLASW